MKEQGYYVGLEEGTYIGSKLGKKKDGTEERMLEVLKNVEIIGIHTSRVRLVGSVVKRSRGEVTFRNITFQVGKDQGSSESIYAKFKATFRRYKRDDHHINHGKMLKKAIINFGARRLS